MVVPNPGDTYQTRIEADIAEAMRAISIAEVAYQAAGLDPIGIGQFGTLSQLFETDQLSIDAPLATGTKYGYKFVVTPSLDDNGMPRYTAVATPIGTQTTSYFADESGVIRFDDTGGIPTSTSPPLDRDRRARFFFFDAGAPDAIGLTQESP